MIKWPLLDYNTAGSTAGSLLIGREKEIDELFDDLKMRNGSIRLIIGESGVGKSALLDDLHRRLTEVENQKNQFFVG